MSGKKLNMRFFLDEGVPDAVARTFRDFGHEAIILRESGLARGSSDQVVCTFAEVSDCILVALDGDMKQLARSNGIGAGRFAKLNLLKISCVEPAAADRVKEAMSLIEHEWQIDPGERTRRLFVEIGALVIRTCR